MLCVQYSLTFFFYLILSCVSGKVTLATLAQSFSRHFVIWHGCIVKPYFSSLNILRTLDSVYCTRDSVWPSREKERMPVIAWLCVYNIFSRYTLCIIAKRKRTSCNESRDGIYNILCSWLTYFCHLLFVWFKFVQVWRKSPNSF